MRLRTGRPKTKAPSASDLLGFAAARLPYEKAALGERDRPIQQQRKCRKDQNAGKNGVDVEGAFRLQDEVAHAARRAQVLADHRADEREQRLEQRDPEVRIDAAGNEPVPGALEDLERLAEEKGGLVRVVEIDRRQERRAGRDVPKQQEAEEQAELPHAQQFS